MEQKYIQTAINYKKNIAGKFVLVEGAKLRGAKRNVEERG